MPTLDELRRRFSTPPPEPIKPYIPGLSVPGWFWKLPRTGPCEECERHGRKAEGTRAPVMTAYGDAESDTPPILCEEHMEEWVGFWQEQWDEYQSGLLP